MDSLCWLGVGGLFCTSNCRRSEGWAENCRKDEPTAGYPPSYYCGAASGYIAIASLGAGLDIGVGKFLQWKKIRQIIDKAIEDIEAITATFLSQNRVAIQNLIDSYHPIKIEFDNRNNTISQNTGIEYKNAEIKSDESIARKAALEIENNDINEIKDVVRGRFVVKNVDEISIAKNTIESHFEIIEKKDKILVPKETGFRDITYIAKVDGKPTEIQIVPKPLDDLNEATHKIMEDWRLLKKVEPMTPEIQAEVNGLLQRIQILNNRAWNEF